MPWSEAKKTVVRRRRLAMGTKDVFPSYKGKLESGKDFRILDARGYGRNGQTLKRSYAVIGGQSSFFYNPAELLAKAIEDALQYHLYAPGPVKLLKDMTPTEIAKIELEYGCKVKPWSPLTGGEDVAPALPQAS